jgi:CheY-like chemotaxis protein
MTALPPYPTRAEFAAAVHDALGKLYDSLYLQAHPLGDLLADATHSALQRGQALRRLLLEAIETLRPGPGVPPQSRDWRAYRILELRYIEGRSPTEIMERLALSRSLFFQEQARVLDIVVETLWERWQPTHHGNPMPAIRPGAEDAVQEELERLLAQATWEPVDVVALLTSLRVVIQPLADVQGVILDLALGDVLMIPRADRVLLRQVFLTLITRALFAVPGGHLTMGRLAAPQIGIRMDADRPAGLIEQPDQEPLQGMPLDDCARLITAMNGELCLLVSGDQWQATIAWSLPAQQVLLVIDDNATFVDLMRRFLTGHGWRVIGAADGIVARSLLAEMRPDLIVLDVLLPREDGWDLLLALRDGEQTRDIPVIVCSALNEQQIAPMLGATAYLPKPVSQPQLLAVLARWSSLGSSP